MPATKSAAKDLKQSAVRHARNLAVKTSVKKAVKETRVLADAKKTDEARTALQKATKVIDKAVQKHVLAANTGARMKSRLTAHIKRASA